MSQWSSYMLMFWPLHFYEHKITAMFVIFLWFDFLERKYKSWITMLKISLGYELGWYMINFYDYTWFDLMTNQVHTPVNFLTLFIS